MTLLEVIRKKKLATATLATVATVTPVLEKPSVAKVASVAVAKQESGKVVSDAERRPDDRHRCEECLYLVRSYCQKWKLTNPGNSRYRPETRTQKRCSQFNSKGIKI